MIHGWLTAWHSSTVATKRGLDFKCFFYPDGPAELQTGVLDQLCSIFPLSFYWRSILTKLTGSSSLSDTLGKQSIMSSTVVFHVIQVPSGWRDKLMTNMVSTRKSCCLCLSMHQWCPHVSAQTGEILPAWGQTAWGRRCQLWEVTRAPLLFSV